jgi:integral membrane sensor domain MASE1/anti-sigma regulatory factor (Ser/Thr protein kinase)
MRWQPGASRFGARDVVAALAVGVTYYGSAQLGLELSLVHDTVTPLWPPTGVAVVAFLALGLRQWPAVAVAAVLVNLPITPSWWAALMIAAGNTVAPVVCVLLLRRLHFSPQLSRLRDAVRLVIVAPLTMAISATVGTCALELSHGLGRTGFADAWWVWWAGDAMGVLIVAPFLWSLWPVRWTRPSVRRAAEAVVLFGLLAGSAWVVSRADGPWLFVVLPFLAWIAWRFQRRGAGFAALVASVIVIVAAVDGEGPFADQSLHENMAVLLLFNAAVSFMSFFFAAAVTERQQAMDRLYRRQRGIAETLQASLLPSELPIVPGVALCARYTPARGEAQIGGDWYDVFALDETTLGIVVGDVAGHGIAASATMAALRAALRGYAIETARPDEALERLNRLVADLHPDVLATVLYGRFDTVERTLDIATAGHPLPLRIDAHGETSILSCSIGLPVGATTAARYRAEQHVLDVGDTVIAFTDGLVERRNRPVDEGTRMLCELAPNLPAELENACDTILESLLHDETPDDVALLALRPMSFAGAHLVFKHVTDLTDVAHVRRALRRWLVDNGATEGQESDILVAASEAHTNAIQHAYDGASGTVHVEIRPEPPGVTVTVRDYGRWRTSFHTSQDGLRGRGIPLMNALVDTVQINSSSRGTEVRLEAPLGAFVARDAAVGNDTELPVR